MPNVTYLPEWQPVPHSSMLWAPSSQFSCMLVYVLVLSGTELIFLLEIIRMDSKTGGLILQIIYNIPKA